MTRKPKLSDIAEKAGVSITTVSFVLNNRMDVSLPEKTRQAVLQAAADIGYQPNHIARALATGKSRMIGVWQALLGGPFHSMVLRQLQNMLRLDGYALLLGDAIVGDREDETYDLSMFARWAVDGLIAIDGPEHVGKYLRSAGSMPLPMLSIGSFPYKLIDYVFISHRNACSKALEHLYHQGCREIVFIVSQWGSYYEGERGLAYQDFARRTGTQEKRLIVDSVNQTGDTRERVKEYISRSGAPDAFYCFSDEIAIGAYKGVRDVGLDVPGDVAITGCDGIEMTEFMDKPITTIIAPIEEMCAISWEFLRKRISDHSTPQQYAALDATLEIRESSIRK